MKYIFCGNIQNNMLLAPEFLACLITGDWDAVWGLYFPNKKADCLVLGSHTAWIEDFLY